MIGASRDLESSPTMLLRYPPLRSHVGLGGSRTQIDLATDSRRIPDFARLAEALGCVALRCDRKEDVAAVIAQARAINDRPVVVDFVVSDNALVWPMIAAGASNDQIMAAEGIRPLFDED